MYHVVFDLLRSKRCAVFFGAIKEDEEMNKLPRRAKTVRANGSDMLNEKQAAEFVGLSVSWLRQSRTKNPSWAGPIFVKSPHCTWIEFKDVAVESGSTAGSKGRIPG